ncbi:hypothetical protein LPJ72_002719 [Coemansia sp. Benny D160-2]|nr:hypothetical protein LPJ72_002719 [Coemansia sp. Benny D160-2]
MYLAVAYIRRRHTVAVGSSRNKAAVAVGIHKEGEDIHREAVGIHKGEGSNTAEEDSHRVVGIRRVEEDIHRVEEDIRREAVGIRMGEGEAGNSMVAAGCDMAQDGLCKASAAEVNRIVHPWAGSRARSSILGCGTD